MQTGATPVLIRRKKPWSAFKRGQTKREGGHEEILP